MRVAPFMKPGIMLLTWLAATLPLGVLPLAAQQSPTPAARLRVVATDQNGTESRSIGLGSLVGDTLRLAAADGSRAFHVDQVRGVELSRGRRGHGTAGLLTGVGIGLAAGLAAVPERDGEGSTGVGAILVPASMALYGGLGMLVGRLIRTERWESVPLDRLRHD
jgi:hypothetical protein